jgi:5-oxoprolinase (ATP-hydrolysing)
VPIAEAAASHRPKPHQVVKTFFEADSKAAASGAGTVGRLLDTSVFLLSSLHAQDRIIGPAIIIDKTSSTLIEPECTAHVNLYGDLEIYVGKPDEGDDDDTPEALAAAEAKRAAEEAAAAKAEEEEIELDNIQLSIFAHRFMSIAEQCGRTLQRTSISTNIKERLSVPKPSTVCAFDSRCCAVFAHC